MRDTELQQAWEAKQLKRSTYLVYWNLAWVVTMAIAAFGPRYIWEFAILPTGLALFTTLIVGFGMIIANKRYLQALDELHQKIFLEAAALTLGVGLVCGLTYELLEDVKVITFEPEISHLVMLMCLTFLTGMILGRRKYQ